MSDAVAGVTFLAVANGAGDLLTALIASGKDDAIDYNVGALIGAGYFVLCMATTLAIVSCKDPLVLNK